MEKEASFARIVTVLSPQVFRAWSLVLLGIVALCAGDILYAYFTVLGREGLGPLVDATYVLAYLGVVLGVALHRRLLAA